MRTLVLVVLLVLCHSICTLPTSFSAQFTAVLRKDSTQTYSGIFNVRAADALENSKFLVEAISTDVSGNSFIYNDGVTYSVIRNSDKSSCKATVVRGPHLQEGIQNILKSENVTIKTVYDGAVQQCIDSGKQVKLFEFEGEHFIMCSVNSIPQQIIGRDIILNISEFTPYSNPLLKKLVLKSMVQCTQVKQNVQNSPMLTVSNQQPWFLDYKSSCKFSWTQHKEHCHRDQVAEPTNKTCVFLHGAGESIIGPVMNASRDYWGDVHLYVPQCSSVIFSFEDTKNNGWDNQKLQKRYCDIALSNQPEGDRVIKNKIIYTHSMANLLLAAGILNKFCEIDLSSTSWYSVDPPFHGSKAANMVAEVCENKNPSTSDALYQWLSHNLGYCVPNEYRAYPGTATNRVEYCSSDGTCMSDLRVIAEKRIKGIQCGTSAMGLGTLQYSAPLSSLAYIVGYGEDNDGLVPESSCMFMDEKDFTEDFTSAKYKSYTNHADGTCRNGNGWWGADRKPCSWYSDKK